MTILAGGAISLQSYLNGRLGKDLGSATIAAAINNMVAFVATLAIVLAIRALPRARDRLRALGRPPVWYFLGGFGGAALVLVSATAAPEVGVALLTVALVCGSTGGSLPVDAAGLGPAGRRPITLPRVAGVLLAVAATGLSALGARGDPDMLLLALALAAGLGMSLQAAANGQLARATGEPWAASLVNVTVGFAALGVVATRDARDVLARRDAGQPAALRRRPARRVRGRRRRHRGADAGRSPARPRDGRRPDGRGADRRPDRAGARRGRDRGHGDRRRADDGRGRDQRARAAAAPALPAR